MSTITQSQTTASVEQFWKAVNIWNISPHVVNRRIRGAVCMFTGKILNSSKELDIDSLVLQIKAACINVTNLMTSNEIVQTLQASNIHVETACDVSDAELCIFIKRLIPRNNDRFQESLELTVMDKLQNEAVFVGLKEDTKGQLLTPGFPYSLSYKEKEREIILKLKTEDTVKDVNKEWLKDQLFPKLVKWAETADCGNEDEGGFLKSSLNLIDIVKYSQLYERLKKKYGPEMIKIWPKNTNPLKYVYEDVAIATYLIIIWEEERLRKGTPDKYQSYVDLGCGNGLLVHILNSEGYQGIGLDLRKRDLWDLYPPTTKLEVRSIVPSAEFLFPETDWIIGNHSDELTPWIPIIAARSSYTCQFFLLPCCCFELNGQKYQRMNSSVSQYEEYLGYIHRLCSSCGFVAKPDRLRIPSTRRICFVSFGRNYPEEDTVRIDCEIKKLIEDREKKNVSSIDKHQQEKNNKWSQDFKPRESRERVRNCTQLERSLIEEIVLLVSRELLIKEQFVTVGSGNEERLWNKGGCTSLGDLASVLPKDKLKKLKNECGGLQTLLRNHSHIFLVQTGKVQMKMPSFRMEPEKKKFRSDSKSHSNNPSIKFFKSSKVCWFHFNHPNGCPLAEEDCTYKH